MKIILFGDSITQGLGSKTINFQGTLQQFLGEEHTVLNWALTGTTVEYMEQLLCDIAREHADAAVILYGNVDGQLKPCRTGKVFPHIHGRLGAENGCMILPRPFYSKRPVKYILQRGENLIRTILRRLIYTIDGTEQLLPLEPFMSSLDTICRRLSSYSVQPYICSTVFIDDKLFPGSDEEYQRYNARMCAYAQEHNLPYIDVYHPLRETVEYNGWKSCYNHDHFHPNGDGYKIMAKEIATVLQTW